MLPRERATRPCMCLLVSCGLPLLAEVPAQPGREAAYAISIWVMAPMGIRVRSSTYNERETTTVRGRGGSR